MTTLDLPNNWTPRKYQLKLWRYLLGGGKRAVALWHRRSGKDEVALHWAAVAAHTRVATYWHMLPEATQARRAIWEAINPHTGIRRIDEAFPHHLRATTREQEMLIKFKNGSTWQVVGSDNFNSLVGSPPAGIVFSEWSIANSSAWGYMRPILAENKGWAIFIYTPRGKNHGYSTFQMAKDDPEWFCQRNTVVDTQALPQSMLDSELAEYKKEYGEEQGQAFFNQEYMCSFDAANIGAVYGAQMQRMETDGRVCVVEHDPALPVHTAWDLGRSDYTVIVWWQVIRGEIRIINHYEVSNADVEDLAEKLYGRRIEITRRDQRTGRVLEFGLGEVIDAKVAAYNYGTNYVPHDAAAKLLAANGRSFVQQLHDLGVKTRVVPAGTDENGHAATRAMLDRSYIHSDLDALVEHLKQYHYAWDNDKKMMSRKPVHDKHSHSCDAVKIIARVWESPEGEKEKPKPVFFEQMLSKDIFKLDSPVYEGYNRIM